MCPGQCEGGADRRAYRSLARLPQRPSACTRPATVESVNRHDSKLPRQRRPPLRTEQVIMLDTREGGGGSRRTATRSGWPPGAAWWQRKRQSPRACLSPAGPTDWGAPNGRQRATAVRASKKAQTSALRRALVRQRLELRELGRLHFEQPLQVVAVDPADGQVQRRPAADETPPILP